MSFIKQVFDTYNLARTDPKKFAEKVEEYKANFEGNLLKIPGTNSAIQTREGPAAYDEAIEFLNKQAPLPPMVGSKGLRKIAKEYKDNLGKVEPSKVGTIDLQSIIEKYGSFDGNFSRMIEYGGQTPERVIINLVVGDGDKNRRQRSYIFGDIFNKIGISSGKHDKYRQFTVIAAATDFENKVDPDDNEDFEKDDEELGAGAPKPIETPKEKPKKVEPPKKVEQPKRVDPPKKSVDPPKKLESAKPGIPVRKEDLEEGVESAERTEKIIVESGRKKKLITITKHMKDGTTKVETKKEPLK